MRTRTPTYGDTLLDFGLRLDRLLGASFSKRNEVFLILRGVLVNFLNKGDKGHLGSNTHRKPLHG